MLKQAIYENKNSLLTGALLSIFLISAIPFSVHAATPSGLFSVTIIAPGNANTVRRQWGAIIANSMTNIGINAKEVFLSWGSVYARVLTPDLSIRGHTFDNGGFDLQLVGFTPALLPIGAEFSTYDSSQFAPYSGNYYLWKNSTADSLIRTAVTSGYSPAGVAALKNWERVQYIDRPEIPILYDTAAYAANPSINYHGWQGLYGNIAPVPQFLSYGTKTSLTVSTTGDFENMLPPLSSSYYDLEAYFPVFDNLFLLTYPKGYPFSDPNAPPQVIPSLATGLTASTDGRTLTYSLRQGVKFQDGITFTSDDVLFTLLAYADVNSGSVSASLITTLMGNDITFKWLNGTTTRLVSNVTAGTAWYGKSSQTPTVKADLPVRAGSVTAQDPNTVVLQLGNVLTTSSPTQIFHPEIDTGIQILPKHYLETVPMGSWMSLPFNTASGTYKVNGVTFAGPFGTGPYTWVSYDSVTTLVHLTKNTAYYNASGLASAGEFTLNDYYLKYIVEKDAAIAALKNGDVDALDPQYHYASEAAKGLLTFAQRFSLPNAGQQEVGINMQHPIFGTGTQTPLGLKDPTKAALAARYVRQAIDFLIPRDLIISNLLTGAASPGDLPFVIPGPYKDSSLTPRPYDPAHALQLLAAAGYATGTTPITIVPPSVPSLILGSPVVASGFFTNQLTGAGYSGFVVILQQTQDNKTWTPVAQTVTDTTGHYLITYVPAQAGTFWYRVSFPGITADSARFAGSARTFNYSKLPTVAAPQFSPVVSVTARALSDVLSQYATGSQVKGVSDQLTQLSSANSQLQSSVSSLQGQVSTLTSVAYGAIALAIIVGVAGFLFARRKPQ